MSFTKACCTLPPVSSDYQPEGTEFTLCDLPMYETKDKGPKTVLICIYDIFGFSHPNIKQFSDKLNSTGLFRVVIPDVFRGKAVTVEQLSGENAFASIMKFVETHGSWDKTVKPDIIAIMDHYKKQGVTSFGIFGFCYGGKMSILAVGDMSGIKGAALIHPSLMEIKDAENAKAPMLFIPSKDDLDMIPMFEIAKKNLGEDKVEHYRFDDVHHGFAGARGDWNDEVQKKRVNEAISLVHAFFKKHLH